MLEGRTLLAEANELVSVVREVGEVGKPSLRLGVSRVAQRFSLLELLRAFERESDVSIVQYELTTREQLDGLRAGALDIGVFTLPAPGAQGLELHVLVEAPNGVWLAATHPLAHRAVISLIDLAELPYLLITREANPDYDEAQLDCCRRAGSSRWPSRAPGARCPEQPRPRSSPRANVGPSNRRQSPPTGLAPCGVRARHLPIHSGWRWPGRADPPRDALRSWWTT